MYDVLYARSGKSLIPEPQIQPCFLGGFCLTSDPSLNFPGADSSKLTPQALLDGGPRLPKATGNRTEASPRCLAMQTKPSDKGAVESYEGAGYDVGGGSSKMTEDEASSAGLTHRGLGHGQWTIPWSIPRTAHPPYLRDQENSSGPQSKVGRHFSKTERTGMKQTP